MMRILWPLLLFTLYNCSSISKKKTPCKAPLVEIHGEDLVSTQVAFDLAFSSYLKACVDGHHKFGKRDVFKDCATLSRAYIDDLMQTFGFK